MSLNKICHGFFWTELRIKQMLPEEVGHRSVREDQLRRHLAQAPRTFRTQSPWIKSVHSRLLSIIVVKSGGKWAVKSQAAFLSPSLPHPQQQSSSAGTHFNHRRYYLPVTAPDAMASSTINPPHPSVVTERSMRGFTT